MRAKGSAVVGRCRRAVAIAMAIAGFGAVGPGSAYAQSPPGTSSPRGTSTLDGFLPEAGGGMVGSAAGILVGALLLRPDACGADDITCQLERLSGVGVAATLGAMGGTLIVSGHRGTPSSWWGAAAGSALGLAAGLGVAKLLEEAGIGTSRVAVLVEVAVVQGLLSAAGSRIGAAVSD